MLPSSPTITPSHDVVVVIETEHAKALAAKAYLPKEMHVAVDFDSVHGYSFGCKKHGGGGGTFNHTLHLSTPSGH
jgi:hypothetical protein